jgi:HEPN domain-containing protein
MSPEEPSEEKRADPGNPAAWLRYAQSDLTLAREDPPEGVMSEMLCFHAQQAAEKAIKAVLLSKEIPFPYTHDLLRLLEQVPGKVPTSVQDATELTTYAVLSRYPADLAPVSEEEHRQAVRWAEAVVAWAEEQMSGEEQ